MDQRHKWYTVFNSGKAVRDLRLLAGDLGVLVSFAGDRDLLLFASDRGWLGSICG